MSILIGSYTKNIYEIKIDTNNHKISAIEVFNNALKPSYLIDYDELSYIYQRNGKQYAKIGAQSVLLGESACHISYDDKNALIYTSHYHDGLLKVLKKNTKWEVISTYQYEKNSHIHFASYIPTIDLVGVCDLGTDALFLYNVHNDELCLVTKYTFDAKTGPRHFAFHKTLPIIYVINELTASLTVLEYNNEQLNHLQTVPLIDGAGSAIRINDDCSLLFTAVRFSNYIFSFEITKNGLLKPIQKIHTYGDHPRDFNLVLDDKYLLVANMNSNNLSLFELNNQQLVLVDSDVKLKAGASILFKK